MKCSICENELNDVHGHNAMPVTDGRCCHNCNYTVVIPIRMQGIIDKKRLEREVILDASRSEEE